MEMNDDTAEFSRQAVNGAYDSTICDNNMLLIKSVHKFTQ